MTMVYQRGLYRIEVHESIDSTNNRALEMHDCDSLVVFAKQQTAGRGRYDRIWSSPPGGLYASIVLVKENDFLAPVRMVAAILKCMMSHKGEGGAEFLYKWPNDVMVGGRKICGVLPEISVSGSVVVGFGINIASCPAHAGCLSDFFDISVNDLLWSVLEHFTVESRIFRDQGREPLINFLSNHLYGKDEKHVVSIGDFARVEGIIKDIDEECGLIIEIRGKPEVIKFGEIMSLSSQ